MAVEGLTSIGALTSLQQVHTSAATGTCISLEVATSWPGFPSNYLRSCANQRAMTVDLDRSCSRAVDGGEGNETPWTFPTTSNATSGLSVVTHDRATIAEVESPGCLVAGATAHTPMQRTLSAPVGAPITWLTTDAFAPGTPPTLQLLTHPSPSGSPPLSAWAPRIPRSIGSMDRAVCHNPLQRNQSLSQACVIDDCSQLTTSTLSPSSLLSAAFRRCLNGLGKGLGHSSSSGDENRCIDRVSPLPDCPFPPSAGPAGPNTMMAYEGDEASSPAARAQLLTSVGCATPTACAATATATAVANVAACDGEQSEGLPGHVYPGEIHGGDGGGVVAVITVAVVSQEDVEMTDAGAAAAPDGGDGGEADDGSGTLLATFGAGGLAPGAWVCSAAQTAAQVALDQVVVVESGGGEAGEEAQPVLLPPYDLNRSSIWRAGNPRGMPPLPRAYRTASRWMPVPPLISPELFLIGSTEPGSPPPDVDTADLADTAGLSKTRAYQRRDEQSAPAPPPLSSCFPRGMASPFGAALNLTPDPDLDSEPLLDWGGARWTRLTSPFAQLAEQQQVVRQHGRDDDKGGWEDPVAEYGHDESYSYDDGYGTCDAGHGDAFVRGASAGSAISPGAMDAVMAVDEVMYGDAAADSRTRTVSMAASAAMGPVMDDDELDDYYLNTLCGGCDPLVAFMQQELARSREIEQVCLQEPKEVGEETADKRLAGCSGGVADDTTDAVEQAMQPPPPSPPPPPPYELQQQYQPAPLEADERIAASAGIVEGTVPQADLQLDGSPASWPVPSVPLPLQCMNTAAVAVPPSQPVAALPEVSSSPLVAAAAAAAASGSHHPIPLSPQSAGFHPSEVVSPLTEVDIEDEELFFELCLADGPDEEAALTEAVTSPRISSARSDAASGTGTVEGGSNTDGCGLVRVTDDAVPLVAFMAVTEADMREPRHSHSRVPHPFSQPLLPPHSQLLPSPPQSPPPPPQSPQSPQPQLLVVTGACCHFHATELHTSHELQLRQHVEALQLQAQQQQQQQLVEEAGSDAGAGLASGGTGCGRDLEDVTDVLCPPPGAAASRQDLQDCALPEVRDAWGEEECGNENDSRVLVVMLERVESCAHCSVAADVRQMVELAVWSNCFWEVGAVAAEGRNTERATTLQEEEQEEALC
ncbi:hypothetical protein VaNZ11_012542 [Volvox africanus]|uniref:Uncharacterized protein n=1 Tax=Volvox africanus TaxID=51714 RepID=A0ABQ5SFG5_9CHLO|nr:hypothetical protein VaNZ11_012542 [Volvox africanus]